MSGPEARTLARALLAGTLLALLGLGVLPRTAEPAARAAASRHASPAVDRGAAASAARDSLADPWHEARALADQGRFDTALGVLSGAIGRGGDDFGLRWLQAGITGEAGRHRHAVVLYESLSRAYPARARDLRRDLGMERLAAGDPAGAARDLRAWLGGHPDDLEARRAAATSLVRCDSLGAALAQYDALLAAEPENTDDQRDRAQLLGWLGRHDAAIAAYRAVLARDSTDADARLGLAMNENWSGRHRVASRRLEALLREPDVDPEAAKALAFARWWDGDPDGAQLALDQYLARRPGDPEALSLERHIARERRATLHFDVGRADDSDGLRIVTTEMELDWPLATATTATLAWRRDNLRDAGGTRDPLRLTAGLARHWGAAWSAYGRLTHTDWGDSAGTPIGGELGVVSRPVDRVRLEGVVSREPVLTRRSLALGISMLDWVGAVDLSPTEAIGLHADGHESDYSDGNHAERLALSARWKAVDARRGELSLLLATEQLHARTDPGHGYYAPHFHREWGPGAEAEYRPSEDWTLSANGQTGWQHDQGADTTPFYTLVGRVEVVVAEYWTLSLSGGRSDSSLENAAGYERRWWQAAIARGF